MKLAAPRAAPQPSDGRSEATNVAVRIVQPETEFANDDSASTPWAKEVSAPRAKLTVMIRAIWTERVVTSTCRE